MNWVATDLCWREESLGQFGFETRIEVAMLMADMELALIGEAHLGTQERARISTDDRHSSGVY